MIDIKKIRDNIEGFKKAAKEKNIDLDFDALIKLDDKRRNLMVHIDELRFQRNELAKINKGGKPSDDQIKRGKILKDELNKLEEEMRGLDKKYFALMVKAPTIHADDTPVAKAESGNVEVEKEGDLPKFDFEPKDHLTLAKELDIIDFKRGVKVSGYRGYYMKNEGASLQMALMMYAMEQLVLKGFKLMIPPTLVREFVLFGSGYFSGDKYDDSVDEIYKIANRDLDSDGKENKQENFLIGTAEPVLLAYHANEVLNEKDLPIKMVGFSPCYRSEIGSYGKDTKGLYRVHEFMKVEQVCITTADVEASDKIHTELIEISKQFHRDMGLPFRLLRICTGDMGAGKYKMFDLEAWMPSRQGYGETGSASNFLDWQARRLNVKYKDSDGDKRFVYMLNNTAVPSPRFIIAILENHQNKDGSVTIPEPLRKFMPGNIEKIEAQK